MKKVYIPEKDEMRELQELFKGYSDVYGDKIYKYLLCKVIEVLVLESKLEKKESILETKPKWIQEHPEISVGICRMYPEEIKHSDFAQNDVQLCSDLLKGNLLRENNIYSLDNLVYFQNGIGIYTNYHIMTSTIETLAKYILKTPQYRFEYQDPNSLIDDIFLCNLSSYEFNSQTAEQLIKIEPANALRIDQKVFNKYTACDALRNSLKSEITGFINEYFARYGISRNKTFTNHYYNEDIVKNPDDNVKRLIKILDRHKSRYQ